MHKTLQTWGMMYIPTTGSNYKFLPKRWCTFQRLKMIYHEEHETRKGSDIGILDELTENLKYNEQ